MIYKQLKVQLDPEVYQKVCFQVKQLSREGTSPGDPGESIKRCINLTGIYPNSV